jgi:large subunit ribosomal protein L7/L12
MKALVLLAALSTLAACGKGGSAATTPACPECVCPPASCTECPPRTYDVVLVDKGPHPIEVIRRVREATGRSLESAKALVDAAPVVVKANLEKVPASELEAVLEQAGARVDVE